jgi:hypothetical protein
MHLAAPELEVDVVVGDDPWEPLRDPPQLQYRRLVRHEWILVGVGAAPKRLTNAKGGLEARPSRFIGSIRPTCSAA